MTMSDLLTHGWDHWWYANVCSLWLVPTIDHGLHDWALGRGILCSAWDNPCLRQTSPQPRENKRYCLTNSGGAPLSHNVSESPTQGGLYVSLLLNFFIKRIVMVLTFEWLWSGEICAPVTAWHVMLSECVTLRNQLTLSIYFGDQGSSQAQITEACEICKCWRDKICWLIQAMF